METVKKFIKEHPHMWWGLYLPVYLTMFFIIEHRRLYSLLRVVHFPL